MVSLLAVAVAVPVIAVARRPAPPPVVHLEVPPPAVRELSPDPHLLRVCADPNNLPFSNVRGDGFENAIAEIVARERGQTVSYFWLPQRRGFVRHSLDAGVCDVVIGVPAGYELVRTTRPYYRSTFVFVSRHGRRPVQSFDDPALRRLTVGIQITGEDYDNPPPALALAARHLTSRVRGFPVYGDYSDPAPLRAIVDAVSEGTVDTAVVWGPVGGYFARHARTPLEVRPVTPASDPDAGPWTFAIAMGVRRDDAGLRDALDAVLVRRADEIARVLHEFGVPLVRPPAARSSGAGS